MFSDYHHCLKAISKSQYSKCTKNCPKPCERIHYQVNRPQNTESTDNSKTTITMEYETFKYPLYIEVPAINWRTLLGNYENYS